MPDFSARPLRRDAKPTADSDMIDSVTFSFGDLDRSLFGMLRVQTYAEPAPALETLAIVFHQTVAVLASASDRISTGSPVDLGALELADIRLTTRAGEEEWTVRRTASAAEHCELELSFRALRPALALHGASTRQLCAVTGAVTVAGQRLAVDCLGQRDHGPAPDLSESEVRDIDAWLDPALAVAIHAERGAEANHEQDRSSAFLL